MKTFAVLFGYSIQNLNQCELQLFFVLSLRGSVVVKTLRYKPEGRGLDTR
jgi:hypothetical protein